MGLHCNDARYIVMRTINTLRAPVKPLLERTSASRQTARLEGRNDEPPLRPTTVDLRQVTPGEHVGGTAITARRVYGGRETHLTGEIRDIEPGAPPRSPCVAVPSSSRS